jgi:hypothetical protein
LQKPETIAAIDVIKEESISINQKKDFSLKTKFKISPSFEISSL